jgi:hypothetical protein
MAKPVSEPEEPANPDTSGSLQGNIANTKIPFKEPVGMEHQ